MVLILDQIHLFRSNLIFGTNHKKNNKNHKRMMYIISLKFVSLKQVNAGFNF
jgi:hypothetical protein